MEVDSPPVPGSLASVALVLAAGRGVRMRSSLPKVLHTIGGVPMIRRVIDSARKAGVRDVVVVLGPEADDIRAALPSDVQIAIQTEPNGTGDAVRAGLEVADEAAELILVLGGDTPLVSSETLRDLAGRVPPAAAAVVAARVQEPRGYGRVVLNGPGQVARIVEEADATPEQRENNLVNGMLFAFNGAWLRATLPTVRPSASGEIYLTSLVDAATQSGRSVQVIEIPDASEILGVNTRQQLAELEALLRARVNNQLMDSGVTLVDPSSTYVEESVVVGRDVVIHPNTHLRGGTVIGDACVVGPGTEIVDSRLGNGVRVSWSVVEGATLGDGVTVGPFGRLRPGAVLDADVALGSFAEVKNSHVGARTQMHHFSYLGDADVGSDVNIGAGAITCNYDGRDKHRTVIGSGVFIGSDTMLVAPVEIGDGAMTGAGSVVTRDVPPDAVVVGVPARRIQRKNRVSNGPGEPLETATENKS